MSLSPTGDSPTTPSMPVVTGARIALGLLLAINLFNYIDRQVLSAVVSKLEVEFAPNDPDSKAKMGMLSNAFMVAYMLLAPLFGWLGDRWSRWKLIGLGVILWSLASGATGLAGSFIALLLTRCFVGVGEAAYGPAAPSLISDLYPVSRRGSVLAWFYMAIPVGSALGFALGGVMSHYFGWRSGFYVVVVPGILLGLACFLMHEPPRGLADKSTATTKGWRDYLVILKTPSYILDTLGMTAMTFVLGGVAFWMPAYIYDREARFVIDPPAMQRKLAEMQAEKKGQPLPAEVIGKLESLAGPTQRTQAEVKALAKAALTEEENRQHLRLILESSQTKDSPSDAFIGAAFGGIVVISGLIATLLGGIAGDRLRPRWSGAYFLVSGLGMLVSYPLFVSILFVPFPYAWGCLFVAVFFLFFNTGPTNTVLANVVHPSMRATAFALNIFIIHAAGDAVSPMVIGAIADRSDLKQAFLIVSTLILLSGVLWIWGAKYLKRDEERAPRLLDRTP